jgi:hypothetical protein
MRVILANNRGAMHRIGAGEIPVSVSIDGVNCIPLIVLPERRCYRESDKQYRKNEENSSEHLIAYTEE